MYGYHCEVCGASLDPGERCECESLTAEQQQEIKQRKEKAKASKPGNSKRRRKPYFMQYKTVYRR